MMGRGRRRRERTLRTLALNPRCVFRREFGLIASTYLTDLLPALAARKPSQSIFLSVEAVRKNMNAALSCRYDKFESTVVRCA